MNNSTIRPFRAQDAQAVAALARRNFTEVNAADYPPEEIERLCALYTPDHVAAIAACSHSYVAELAGEIVGCGSITPHAHAAGDVYILLSIYTRPDLHGAGIGRRIVEALEADEYGHRAESIEIPASITALGFYERMGYGYKNDLRIPDSEGLVRMVKRVKVNPA